jgi:hypothetical protein
MIRFIAPGGDLMCGTARSYQVATSRRPITPQTFKQARRLRLTLRPATAGSRQQFGLPRGTLGWIAIRAVDAAGNVGRPMVLKLR